MHSSSIDHDLIIRYLGSRDQNLREEIIVHSVPLVHFVLSRLGFSQSLGADYEDAASQGLLGLIEAVDRFNPEFGSQFSTYAILRIRGKVLDHLRALDWLSRGARQRVNRTKRAISEFWTKHHRAPSEQELASYLKLDKTKLRQSLADGSRTVISLEAAIDRWGEESDSLLERFADERQTEPSEMLEEGELKTGLERALRTLTGQERRVLALYYSSGLTLRETGNRMGISESRAYQLRSRAEKKLKACLEKDGTGAVLH